MSRTARRARMARNGEVANEFRRIVMKGISEAGGVRALASMSGLSDSTIFNWANAKAVPGIESADSILCAMGRELVLGARERPGNLCEENVRLAMGILDDPEDESETVWAIEVARQLMEAWLAMDDGAT